MLGLNRNLTVRFDYGYLRLWGPILTGKSSRRKLRCTIQTGTVIQRTVEWAGKKDHESSTIDAGPRLGTKKCFVPNQRQAFE